MSRSEIEWTEATWNPSVGCKKVSPGCANCYANRMHWRLGGTGMAKYAEDFSVVRPWPPDLNVPLRQRKASIFFVNSMSDLFHEDLPERYISQVFGVMVAAYGHIFQVLTKRAQRLVDLAPHLPWPRNVWMGVSVETDKYLWRADLLCKVSAAVRFLSLEPLLGPLPHLDLSGIHWVIVGGESGPGARPCDPQWVRQIRDQCVAAGVPLFFKQWGKLASNPDRLDPTAKENGGGTKGGQMLDGRIWNQMPAGVTLQKGTKAGKDAFSLPVLPTSTNAAAADAQLSRVDTNRHEVPDLRRGCARSVTRDK